MRRICCFVERWGSGGIESFLCNALLHMNMSGIEVDIVAVRLEKSVFTQPLKANGVRFYQLSGKLRSLANGRAFLALLKERKYDVVHLNMFHSLSFYYGYLAKKAEVPIRIAHSHNTALRKSAGRPLKLMLHSVAKELFTGSATDLWACSEAAADFLFSQRLLKHKGYRFIHNGIDTERFRFDPVVREQTRRELRLEDVLVVGCIGRLCYQKNQFFLLRVFEEIQKLCPWSVLLLIGEGEDRSKLEEKAKTLGIKDNVIFYGTTDKVERFYWAMDVFLLPSRFEGLPVAGLEAQTTGLPCFFSDIITREGKTLDTTEFLSLDCSPRQWADAVLKRTATGDRSTAVSTTQSAGFDIFDVAHQIESIYRG